MVDRGISDKSESGDDGADEWNEKSISRMRE